MERLLLASVSTALLGYVAYAFLRGKKQSRKHGRAALAADDQQFTRPATTGGVSQRIAKARANCLAAGVEARGAAGSASAFWSDPLFTHDDSSLFMDPSRPPEDWLRDGERGKVIKGAEVVWCPPPKFCTASRPLGKRARDGGATWLYGDADDTGAVSAGASQNADDVAQGSLGDCYTLSALALATRDGAVCDDLIDDTYEDVGIYGVTLCVRGRWTMVWVDAQFPCWRPINAHGKQRRPKPIYATSSDHREIWPNVVEKAYAKVAGSYEAIGRGGRIAPALETLTGGAAWSVDAMTIPWKDLRRAVEDNDVFVGAGSEHNLSERELEGVVGGHAYSILHAVDVGEGADRVRLLLLRNPWGKSEWKATGATRRPAGASGRRRAPPWATSGRTTTTGASGSSCPTSASVSAPSILCRVKNGQLKERNVLGADRGGECRRRRGGGRRRRLAGRDPGRRAADAAKAPRMRSASPRRSKKKGGADVRRGATLPEPSMASASRPGKGILERRRAIASGVNRRPRRAAATPQHAPRTRRPSRAHAPSPRRLSTFRARQPLPPGVEPRNGARARPSDVACRSHGMSKKRAAQSTSLRGHRKLSKRRSASRTVEAGMLCFICITPSLSTSMVHCRVACS